MKAPIWLLKPPSSPCTPSASRRTAAATACATRPARLRAGAPTAPAPLREGQSLAARRGLRGGHCQEPPVRRRQQANGIPRRSRVPRAQWADPHCRPRRGGGLRHRRRRERDRRSRLCRVAQGPHQTTSTPGASNAQEATAEVGVPARGFGPERDGGGSRGGVRILEGLVRGPTTRRLGVRQIPRSWRRACAGTQTHGIPSVRMENDSQRPARRKGRARRARDGRRVAAQRMWALAGAVGTKFLSHRGGLEVLPYAREVAAVATARVYAGTQRSVAWR